MSSPTSPTHIVKLTGPSPNRSFLRSGHPLPLSPTLWSVAPTYVALSLDCAPRPSSRPPKPTELSQVTWRRRLGLGDPVGGDHSICFRTSHYPMPVSAASVPLPGSKFQSLGAGHWGPCGTQTCLAWGTWGRVCYHPPRSQSCPTHVSSQWGPPGWTGLMPNPGTLLPSHGFATSYSVRRPGKSGASLGGGGGFPWYPRLKQCWL